MANLKDIRNRIKSVTSIQQVTKAMKMVAAAKMRRAQENMEHARPYTYKISNLLDSLLFQINRSILPELEIREEIKKKLFVVVTADRGMAAAFNSNIIKIAQKSIDDFGKDKSHIICIGKKGINFFKHRNYKIVSSHQDFWNELNFKKAIQINEQILNYFVNRKVDEVVVIYNKFVNVGKQEIQNEVFLPLSCNQSKNKENKIEQIYEPSKDEVVKKLVPRYLNTVIWQYLLESFASEQAARMVAMENATTNAQDMIKDLKLQFNKARQTAITTEMLEIVSGAEALS